MGRRRHERSVVAHQDYRRVAEVSETLCPPLEPLIERNREREKEWYRREGIVVERVREGCRVIVLAAGQQKKLL